MMMQIVIQQVKKINKLIKKKNKKQKKTDWTDVERDLQNPSFHDKPQGQKKAHQFKSNSPKSYASNISDKD